MNDIFGNPVSIGDTVAFNPPLYKGLTTGTVLKFTPKGFTVQYQGTGWNTGQTQTNVKDVVKKFTVTVPPSPKYEYFSHEGFRDCLYRFEHNKTDGQVFIDIWSSATRGPDPFSSQSRWIPLTLQEAQNKWPKAFQNNS